MNAPRLPTALQPAWARARQQWQGLAPRERLGLQPRMHASYPSGLKSALLLNTQH